MGLHSTQAASQKSDTITKDHTIDKQRNPGALVEPVLDYALHNDHIQGSDIINIYALSRSTNTCPYTDPWTNQYIIISLKKLNHT